MGLAFSWSCLVFERGIWRKPYMKAEELDIEIEVKVQVNVEVTAFGTFQYGRVKEEKEM
jgi:hypothetical protein